MQKRKIFFSFVLSALLSILCYIVLHEAGHCIVAILCGATITEFSILSAHMNYSGGNFTALSALFLSANGNNHRNGSAQQNAHCSRSSYAALVSRAKSLGDNNGKAGS